MKAVELAKKVYERRRKYFENIDFYLNLIKERTKVILPDAKIYLFGSVVEGKTHPHSDIDVAIVTNKAPKSIEELAKIKAKILEGLEFSPFELHILSEKEWSFYRNFVKKFKEV